ncbi:aminoglycoside 3-N-acetyltransferase, partial [Escherichia coli]
LGRHREGVVGFAQCYLFDAQDIVTFGVTYLEKHFGTTPIVPPHEAVERSCEPSG